MGLRFHIFRRSPFFKEFEEFYHAPDDDRKFDVKPLLSIIEDILQPATPAVPGFGLGAQLHSDVSKDESFQSGNSIDMNSLSAIIHEISGKVSSKFSDGVKKHVTGEIFQIVKHYDWDAKAVLALAAFAFSYGEFWVLAQPDPTNSIARSVPLLKQLPETPPPEHVGTLKPKFEELSNLMKAILDITKCIIQLQEINHERENVPYGVYWTIRSILACTSQIMSIVGMGYKNISSRKASKLPFLAQTMRIGQRYFQTDLTNCQKSEERKRHDDKYKELVKLIETQHENNIDVLKALIYDKEDMLPLLEGSTEARVSMEVLMRKYVLLLISNLSVSDNEISMLNQKYQESRLSKMIKSDQFELVWLPVIDKSTPWTQAKQDQFENLQLKIPWYSVYHPSMIDPAVIMYIKEVWQFDNEPILVVLDPRGKVINNNALHMLWIWGRHAFPFTRAREEELWKKEETWTIEFLVDGIDPAILIWIAENKYVCLYGGEDIDWIRKFTISAKEVAQAASIPLEVLYVGKSNPQEKVSQTISIIGVEKLSYSIQDLTSIWYFWVRLGSMRQSKKILGSSVENDPIMQEIESLLSFDGNNQSWAIFCTRRGSAMAKAEGETILKCLNEFSLWKTQVNEKDFVTALNEYHNRKLSLARLMESPHTDNMNVLRALIYAKEDKLPLLQGATKTRASLEVLIKKHVLLLISNLDVSYEELYMLNKTYQEPRDTESQFELVWLPVADESWKQTKPDRFEELQSIMKWYSVCDPSMIDPVVVLYIKELWQFKKKPILVVLDPQGKIINKNAFCMLWIWGSRSFPFTSDREEALWKKVSWKSDFFVDNVEAAIPSWIKENKYICLYGGEDIEWIKKFTTSAKEVAQATHSPLEMLYMGKSNPSERINENISTINVEKLSHSLQDITSVCYFWVRLASMSQSKKQLIRSGETDPVMKEIETMLDFGKSGQGWALLGRESNTFKAKGETILKCFKDFNLWKTHVTDRDLLTALNVYNRKLSLAQLIEKSPKDNMEVLKAVIYAKEDQLPLLDFATNATNKKASLEVLKRKYVLLLISDLNVSHEELHMLKQKYQVSLETESQCELVWLPVADESWNQAKQEQFEKLQSIMQWYSVSHPSIIDAAVIMYIKDVWQFNEKPIIVVLNPEGEVVNNNALHMIWIWGSVAFPFTRAREEELWKKEEIWTIDLFVDNVDAAIAIWIAEDKYICLYGGEEIEWIKKFTATANEVKQAASIPMEILYMGKSNPQEKVRKNIYTITGEGLSHTLKDLAVWFFWVRLESMWHSKKQLGRSLENDSIMQDVDTILSFDRSEQGWAVFCKGSDMAKDKGEIILQCLKDFNLWKSKVEERGFVNALKNHLSVLHNPPQSLQPSDSSMNNQDHPGEANLC